MSHPDINLLNEIYMVLLVKILTVNAKIMGDYQQILLWDSGVGKQYYGWILVHVTEYIRFFIMNIIINEPINHTVVHHDIYSILTEFHDFVCQD